MQVQAKALLFKLFFLPSIRQETGFRSAAGPFSFPLESKSDSLGGEKTVFHAWAASKTVFWATFKLIAEVIRVVF